jgi:CRISPR type II-A-associated protein Csn2
MDKQIELMNDYNEIISFFYKAFLENSTLDLSINEEFSIDAWLKLLDIRIANIGETTIFGYLQWIVEVCSELQFCKLLIFPNISYLLTEIQIVEFAKCCSQHKVCVLMIDKELKSKRIDNAVIYQIDEDFEQFRID